MPPSQGQRTSGGAWSQRQDCSSSRRRGQQIWATTPFRHLGHQKGGRWLAGQMPPRSGRPCRRWHIIGRDWQPIGFICSSRAAECGLWNRLHSKGIRIRIWHFKESWIWINLPFFNWSATYKDSATQRIIYPYGSGSAALYLSLKINYFDIR